MSNEQKGTRDFTSANSPMNALSFLIENTIKNMVNVAIPVRVDAVAPSGTGGVTGTLTCTPLISQRDVKANVLPPTKIFEVPYMRLQGGVAAVVVDPVVGDIGIAVFAQQDISNIIDNKSVPPASYRNYDQADAIYIGGIINQAPTIWLEMTQEGNATLHAPIKITLEAPDIEINGASSIKLTSTQITLTAPQIVLDSPQTNITGNLTTTGVQGSLSTMAGSLNVKNDVTASGISLNSHTHNGVAKGASNTGGPH